jgi:predicted peptidase
MDRKKIKTILSCLLLSIIFFNNAFADTLVLKEGKMVAGEIIENTEEYVRIDVMGIGFIKKYKKSSIESVNMSSEPDLQIEDKENLAESPKPAMDQVLTQSQTVKNNNFILYIPQGIESGEKYPLIVGFHPGGNAQAVIDQWKPLADKYKLFLYATLESRNGQDMMSSFPVIKQRIENEVLRKYPIHRRKIIATGISGGGMGSHFMSFMFNDFISAVVVNTGMMHEHQKQRISQCAKNKLAVMLASPTDFRYDEMIEDNKFLMHKLNWQTKWIEFEGGHAPAPQQYYEQGMEWLLNKL